MEAIAQVFEIDIVGFILALFAILSAVVAAVKIIESFSKTIGKPVKWIKTNTADHGLLQETVDELEELRIESTENDKQFKEDLKELTTNVKALTESGKHQGEQIDHLITGTMELLGDKIDDRFSRYLSLGGIPENEVAEFDGIYMAYKETGGNSGREYKYNYVKKHMPIIPVEINIVTDD